MFRTLSVFVIMSVLFVLTASAQMADQQAALQRTEMKKFEKMIGVWEGEGWVKEGPKTTYFRGMETVQWKVDGVAVLVEGLHKNKPAAGETEKVIHETLAVISFDTKEKLFRFRTFLATGAQGSHEIKAVSADTFEWGLGFPGGTGAFKYTIKMTDKTWFEIGEYTRDGKEWTKFFEMTLQKRK